ncbi:MAG: hypothetical protein JST75_09030 [Bacteroidetes bacterium]|nr:hypothetical protein [Bacteroidota bacterium]
MKKIIYPLISILFFAACKKDNGKPVNPGQPNPPGGNAAYFFANTQWVGTTTMQGQTYPQPLCIRFDNDTGVTLYALYSLLMESGFATTDSLHGKITSIENASSSGATINVSFEFNNDQQTYKITNANDLTGGSTATSMAHAGATFNVHAEICPTTIPTVTGTSWQTGLIANGPSAGRIQFPDLNALNFDPDGRTSYLRNNLPVTYTSPDQDEPLLFGYQQIGPRIYFAGYNEDISKLVLYFGVLSADGSKILADTRNRIEGRVPSYIESYHVYGDPGVTPTTHKVTK